MSTESLKTENKMGTQPIGSLLVRMAIPMILSMLIQALYNMVDSIFVAMVSEDALTAVSLAYPVQNMMIALAAGMAVGINALISSALGRKDTKAANTVAWNGFLIEAILYVVFLLFGLFASEWFMQMQNIEDATGYIQGAGATYIRIVCIYSFGFFLQVFFERTTLAAGKTGYSMTIQLIGAIINIIMDPIMIFGLLGFPAMGVAGAAYATVLGQIIGGIAGIIINQKKNPEVKLQIKNFIVKKNIIGNIITIGIPSTVMTGLVSVLTFVMNAFLLTFSKTTVAFYGIYNKLYTFVQMPVTGVNNAVIPIFSYNYGAKNKDRMTSVVKKGCIFAFALTLVMFLVFEIIPEPLLTIFNASSDMMSFGIVGMRIIAISFLFYGISIILTSVLQATGKAISAISISLLRQIVVLLPIAWFFTSQKMLDGVWTAFIAAELVGLIVALALYIRFEKKEIHGSKPLNESNPTHESVIKESKPGVIITIAREHGSQGKQIGKLVAERLGIPFYYKEMTALAAQEIGFDKEFVSSINKNSPTLLRDLYLSSAPIQDAIIAQDKIIKRIADNGSCVIVGRAADYVLRDYPDVVSVFLYAPEEYRIGKIMEMYGDTADEAEKNMKRADAARAAYYKSISGNSWGDTPNYDICLDCGNGIESTADRIISFIKQNNH